MTSVEIAGALKFVSLQTEDVPVAALLNQAARLLNALSGADFAVTVHANSSNKIQSIKFVRQANGVTLKAAKDAVEAGPVEVFRGPEYDARAFAQEVVGQFTSLTLQVEACV
jgi:ribosomal protein L7/L12